MADTIVTLETLPEAQRCFATGAPVTMWSWVAWLCLTAGKKAPERAWLNVGIVKARINWGRWIADCPHCFGALVVSRIDPYFWCPQCEMKQSGWHQVEFPENADEIEAILVKRPDSRTRNWSPGETLEQLEAENVAHGIEVFR